MNRKLTRLFEVTQILELNSNVSNGFLDLENINTIINSNFCDDWISETGQVIFFQCDRDLTLLYEVIQSGSSNILTELYVGFIWLDTLKISSKSDVRLIRYCKFSSGVFFYPPPPPLGCFFTPPPCSLPVKKTLHLSISVKLNDTII